MVGSGVLDLRLIAAQCPQLVSDPFPLEWHRLSFPQLAAAVIGVVVGHPIAEDGIGRHGNRDLARDAMRGAMAPTRASGGAGDRSPPSARPDRRRAIAQVQPQPKSFDHLPAFGLAHRRIAVAAGPGIAHDNLRAVAQHRERSE